MTTGKRIREQRQRLGLTQLDVARQLGVHTRYISDWERDVFSPTMRYIVPLAGILQTSTDYLLTGDLPITTAN